MRVSASAGVSAAWSTGVVLCHLAAPARPDALHDARPVLHDRAVHALPVVRDRRVRARHVERVDGDETEPDREVRRKLRADPEPVRGLDDRPRADDVRELRVDRVVRVHHRRRQVDAAQVAALVVRDRPDAIAGVDLDRLRRDVRLRGDALAERGREHDRLEGRPGLPLRLRGEVELAAVEVRAAEHRLHRPGVRVDRDERGRRPVRVGEDLLDRLARLVLEVEVDRRRHLEPAAEDALGAVARDELIGDVVDEVRSGALRAREPDVLRLRQRRRVRAPHLGGRDPALVVELLQHVGASLERRRGMLHRVVERRARGDPGQQRRLRGASAPRRALPWKYVRAAWRIPYAPFPK